MREIKQQGFTLIELAVVMTVVGLLVGTMVSMFQPYMEQVRINTTQKKLENISSALAVFAQKYGRLPCPAEPNSTDSSSPPYGYPRNSNSDGMGYATNTCGAGAVTSANNKGMVPFKALGLSEENVTDSYGNLITYAVNQYLTRFNASTRTSDNPRVHDMCRRSPAWIENGVNKNLLKAYLCCADVSTGSMSAGGITILDTDGNYSFPNITPSASSYSGNPDSPISSNTYDNQFLAFVLISHGLNGDGAYLPHSSSKRNVYLVGAREYNNHASNVSFVEGPISTATDSNYFDDIVVWKTNDQLAMMAGGGSCRRP
jgi:prepilin-type N-terminal cleavage/methylation domain-containing protein